MGGAGFARGEGGGGGDVDESARGAFRGPRRERKRRVDGDGDERTVDVNGCTGVVVVEFDGEECELRLDVYDAVRRKRRRRRGRRSRAVLDDDGATNRPRDAHGERSHPDVRRADAVRVRTRR